MWKTGRIQPGLLSQSFYDKTVHFPAAPVSVRNSTFWKTGGYTALGSNEDTNLLIKLDKIAQGYFINESLYMYRRWENQHTQEDIFKNRILAEQRRRVNLKTNQYFS